MRPAWPGSAWPRWASPGQAGRGAAPRAVRRPAAPADRADGTDDSPRGRPRDTARPRRRGSRVARPDAARDGQRWAHARRSVATVGPPNTGKSTFFNRLTGASARVANWPGMTVDITTARVLLGGNMVRLADLPGIYSLEGHSDDEAVVRRFLATVPLDAIVALVNATRIELQLPLVLALKATGVPLVVRAQHGRRGRQARRGASTPAGLAAELRVPVVAVSAKYGQGMGKRNARWRPARRARRAGGRRSCGRSRRATRESARPRGCPPRT